MKQRYKVFCCDDIVEVDTEERWTINYCKCGTTGIDAEKWYTRFTGGKAQLLGDEGSNSRD